jgi:acylphosphatase
MSEKQSIRVCRHYHVVGRVQGVWFRGTTQDQARQLGLSGWVRNCEDGSVEAVACGSREALDKFRSWLHRGPRAARVDRVDEAEASDAPEGDDFTIRP